MTEPRGMIPKTPGTTEPGNDRTRETRARCMPTFANTPQRIFANWRKSTVLSPIHLMGLSPIGESPLYFRQCTSGISPLAKVLLAKFGILSRACPRLKIENFFLSFSLGLVRICISRGRCTISLRRRSISRGRCTHIPYLHIPSSPFAYPASPDLRDM